MDDELRQALADAKVLLNIVVENGAFRETRAAAAFLLLAIIVGERLAPHVAQLLTVEGHIKGKTPP